MAAKTSIFLDNYDDPLLDPEREEDGSDEDLWFLPEAVAEEDLLPPGPHTWPSDPDVIEDWEEAQSLHAARLAHVAARIGALDDRMKRGPQGWRHRLALIEVAGLSALVGNRVGSDRLALWLSMRLSGVQDDANALARAGWAVRRLTGGPGPQMDLPAFLDRRDPDHLPDQAEPFADRAASWLELMARATGLHPITRACLGFHVWNLAGLEQNGGKLEASVTAARMAMDKSQGAIFAPLAMGGAGGLRGTGAPKDRLNSWLEGMETACLAAMRQLDDIEAWSLRANEKMTRLSGKTPAALQAVLMEWPLVSAAMGQTLTGASRAAVQRNLNWMQENGLIRDVTGQGRFRMWKAVIT